MSGVYYSVRGFSLLWDRYAYVDSPDYCADGLLAKHNVRIKFAGEMVHSEKPYCIIFCKVRKQDRQKFEAAMEELPNKMLICGYGDYLDFCENLDQWIKQAHEN